MTQRLCEAIRERGGRSEGDVDGIVGEMFLSHRAKDGDDNLANVRKRLLEVYDDRAALLDLYGKVLAGKRVSDGSERPAL